jgi:prepilin-type N-terminal cleavage/methylation domain-containing protein
MISNDRGLTLIEVMIASLIILILFLALMQSVLLSVNMNNKNQLRDAAVSVAEERMRELRSLDFDDTILSAAIHPPAAMTNGTVTLASTVTRNFRNFTRDFNMTHTITDLGVPGKSITVRVSYMNIKDNTCSVTSSTACDADDDCPPGETCGSTHTITSILRESD